MYCEKHDIRWDSDTKEQCPSCEQEQPVCELCGEPMPEGEEMFKYHGYSGPCSKP